MWDQYSSAARIADYDPLSLNQNLRGIASLNWKIINGLTYHTDLSYGRSWGQQKYWSGATYNNYIDDVTGTKLYAGNADYRKSDSWAMRWSNTLNYEFNINPQIELMYWQVRRFPIQVEPAWQYKRTISLQTSTRKQLLLKLINTTRRLVQLHFLPV
jgi:hypothetical protein